MAVLLITHNFGIVAETADRTAVMYAGRIVETGPTAEIFESPQHPYTEGLLGAIPTLGDRRRLGRRRLREIPGIVPRLTRPRTSCSFAPRCDRRFEACFVAEPDPAEINPGHAVRCFAAAQADGQALPDAPRVAAS